MLQPSQVVLDGRDLLSKVFCLTNSPPGADERQDGQDDDTSNQRQNYQDDKTFHELFVPELFRPRQQRKR